MKARVERGALIEALATVAPAVKEGSMPALACVRIDTVKAGLTLTSTDLNTTITTDIIDGAGIGKPGSIVAPHRLLARYVKAMPSGAVDLDLAGEELTISVGDKASGTMRTVPVNEWPRIDTDRDDWSEVKLTPDDVDRIRRVAVAAETDLNRSTILSSVCLGGGWAVATDSYRLHATEIDLDADPVLVPAATFAAALKASDGAGCTLQVDRENGLGVAITTGRTTWATRLVQGEFPKWQRLIPTTDTPHYLTANREELIDALRTTGTIFEEKGKDSSGKTTTTSVPVRFQPEGGLTSLTTRALDQGEMVVHVAADTNVDFAFAMNPGYLRPMLEAAAPDETVTIRLIDALKPVTFRAGGLTLLAMPVRVTT